MKAFGVRNATLMAVAPVESSSVVINSTNGIEMPMSLITVKESKAGSLIQVAPEYNKLKTKYQLMWEQKDCDGYLKTAAVIAAYVDQSISTNTFYNPAHFADRKVPTTLIAKNLMLAHRWGLKTFYYSLINKQGSKGQDEPVEDKLEVIDFSEEEDCEACKL
jgi:ribonucleoside-diphosphate reductase alpha chain